MERNSKHIENKTFDEERTLYNQKNTQIESCHFGGKSDGESALKECRNCEVVNCSFSSRYPLWHAKRFRLINSKLDTQTRAPIWYSNEGHIENCIVNGVKCLRACKNINLSNCKINSEEFGWKCKNISILNSNINSKYFLFETENAIIEKLNLTGKYSFQYTKDLQINNSELDTKDAFWHSKNIKVTNSTIKGEYLGWYSENLTLENCRIIGTQPLCYCKKLKLVNCTMENTDLSFEYSEVEAQINGHIESIKNPKSGRITANSIGKIIKENSIVKIQCKIETKQHITQ